MDIDKELLKSLTAETQSTQREELLPNRETTIGQNLRASREKSFCLSSSPDKQKKAILCALCASAVNKSYSAFISENSVKQTQYSALVTQY
jgi:hypothetical protein